LVEHAARGRVEQAVIRLPDRLAERLRDKLRRLLRGQPLPSRQVARQRLRIRQSPDQKLDDRTPPGLRLGGGSRLARPARRRQTGK
jgi:hypothetical protein